ncbi:MAG TPA: methionyl-tRNA formyltransferase [Salinimicrobium sp.]|nr:methionyl-tRNA formyltransferase [Salinimicrobium sp.]
MKELRLVFMGTPEFSVFCLKKIVEASYNVVGVVTAPDKPAGRGRKIHESAVKQFAIENNLPVLQPTNLKDPMFISELKKLNPDVHVVIAFRMLPEMVWKVPTYGTFNLHASLLPQYRGAAPINWAIINGEKITGVTTFFIDEKIDTGRIVLQKSVEISKNETAGSLHDKLMEEGSSLVIETLELIEKDKVESIEQPSIPELKSAPKLTKENTKIDWNQPLDRIYNHIRGLNPYPAAWVGLVNGNDDLDVKFFEVEKLEEEHSFESGQIIIEDKTLKVAHPEGFLIVKEIQLPGKKRMKTKELLNGFKFHWNAKLR